MIKKTFKLSPSLWLGNRSLRTCSAAARGFWVDLLCLVHPEGRLLLNGHPMSDTDISRLTGEPVKSVRAWLKELGDANIYSVDDKGLYSSKMVKEANFYDQAKVSGSRGQKRKKEKAEKITVSGAPIVDLSNIEPIGYVVKSVEIRPPVIPPTIVSTTNPKKTASKSLPWYKSPAGWVRHGQSQATSMNDGESLDDFKFRLSCKIPPGPHIEELTSYHKAEVLRIIGQYAPKEGEQRSNFAQDR